MFRAVANDTKRNDIKAVFLSISKVVMIMVGLGTTLMAFHFRGGQDFALHNSGTDCFFGGILILALSQSVSLAPCVAFFFVFAAIHSLTPRPCGHFFRRGSVFFYARLAFFHHTKRICRVSVKLIKSLRLKAFDTWLRFHLNIRAKQQFKNHKKSDFLIPVSQRTESWLLM